MANGSNEEGAKMNGAGGGGGDDISQKLKEFAQTEYKMEPSAVEGKDRREMIELLVKSMVAGSSRAVL